MLNISNPNFPRTEFAHVKHQCLLRSAEITMCYYNHYNVALKMVEISLFQFSLRSYLDPDVTKAIENKK